MMGGASGPRAGVHAAKHRMRSHLNTLSYSRRWRRTALTGAASTHPAMKGWLALQEEKAAPLTVLGGSAFPGGSSRQVLAYSGSGRA